MVTKPSYLALVLVRDGSSLLVAHKSRVVPHFSIDKFRRIITTRVAIPGSLGVVVGSFWDSIYIRKEFLIYGGSSEARTLLLRRFVTRLTAYNFLFFFKRARFPFPARLSSAGGLQAA